MVSQVFLNKRLFNKIIKTAPLLIISSCLSMSLYAEKTSILSKPSTHVAVPAKRLPIFLNELKPVFPGKIKPSLERDHTFLPPIQELKLFRLEKPMKTGFNGVTTIRFNHKQARAQFPKRSFVSRIDDQKMSFNDLGIGADSKANDGIFSAFNRIDFDAFRKSESRTLARFKKSDKLSVKEFSGRSVISVKTFDINKLSTNDKAIRREIIILPSGARAFRIPILFGGGASLPFTADESKVLAINSPSVVANPSFTFDPCDTDGTGNNFNPNADWSFKTLISNLNQGTGLTNQEFIHEWLRNWMVNGNVNGFTLNARVGVLEYFQGWDGVNAATLDIDNLPFRILAITNRIDLAKISYASAAEGEIRFVFGLLDPNTCSPASVLEQMTVIFEYGDTANTCSTIKVRADQWLDLDSDVLGSVSYMNKLKAITDDVTTAPIAASALNQLRTNDFAFDQPGVVEPWELREFVIAAGSGLLEPTTIKQTPDASFRTGNPVLAQYLEQNATNILCENYTVPTSFLGSPFLGGGVEYQSATFWNAPTNQGNLPASFPGCYDSSIVASGLPLSQEVQSEVRHKFSVNTCDDCHAKETNTFFTHINPFTRGLSGFMTGITVPDPLIGPAPMGITRQFDDLARRGQIMMDLSASQCFGGAILKSNFVQKVSPKKFVH